MRENLQRHRRVLPHWTADNAIYFVTFRLHDSLPAPLVKNAQFEYANLTRTAEQMRRDLSYSERARLRSLRRTLEVALDKGHGRCWMNDPAIARIVAEALTFFDAARYDLFAWCVMPNHVHVVVRPAIGWQLFRILHSSKSFTAHQITRNHRCPRPFWQREYYDRIMRDDYELSRAVRYVENNPVVAGLANWVWVSSCT